MSEKIASQQVQASDLDEIQEYLTSGDLDKAEAALADLPSEHDQLRRAKLLESRLKAAQGDNTEASAIAAEHLVQHAESNPWIWSQCVTVFAKENQNELAREVFLKGVAAAHAANEQVALAGLDAVMGKTAGHAEKVALLSEALELAPDARNFQMRLATRHMLGGQPQKALELFAKAEATGPLPAHAERTKTMLYPFVAGYSEALDRMKAETAEVAANSIQLRRMARYATAAHRFDDAYAALSEALDRFPGDWLVLYRLVRSRLSDAERNNMLGRLYDLRGNTKPESAWLLQLGVLALQAGDTERAIEILSAVDSSSTVGWTARALSGALAEASTIGPAHDALQTNEEIVEIARPDAVGTVIVFGNMTGGLELLPFSYLDGLLSDLPLNVIYLRDFSGLMFQQGLQTCGKGDVALHERLRASVAKLGGPVLTIGNSFGANPAIRAAMEIENAKALSLAGAFDLTEDLEDGNSLNSQGAWEMKNAGPLVDLFEKLGTRPDLLVTHVYGEQFERDVKRAERIGRLPNCSLLPINNVGHHFVGMECIARNQLIPLIQEQFRI